MVDNYESRVDSYICEHHDQLQEPLAEQLRQGIRAESPLTEQDAQRWIAIIKKTMGHHTLKGVVCKAPCF